MVSGAADSFTMTAVYNGNTVTSGPVSASGSIIVDKNVVSESNVNITLNATGALNVIVTVGCPQADELTIIEVVLTDNNEAGDSVHVQYRYVSGAFTSPLQSNFVSFTFGSNNPLVSRYNSMTGFVGAGGFPAPGSTVSLFSNKIGFDSFVFDPLSDKFRYLESDTLYANNSTDLFALLSASSNATPISGGGNTYYSSFPFVGGKQYLYLIWDFRAATPLELCFSSISARDTCCSCVDCGLNCVTYTLDVPAGDGCVIEYSECGTGDLIQIALLGASTNDICTSGAIPQLVSGDTPVIGFKECGCDCIDPCSTWEIVVAPELPVSPVVQYIDCSTGIVTSISPAVGSSYICVQSGTMPVVVVGTATLNYLNCGCLS